MPSKKPRYFIVLGKFYYTDNIKRNFDNSQANYKEIFPIDGKLFEPRDQTTNEEVAKANENYHSGGTGGWAKWAWIGIKDKSSQGIYEYLNDNGPLTTSQWALGEPSNDNKYCVVICNSNGDWCDQECSLARYHVCESAYYANQIESLKFTK